MSDDEKGKEGSKAVAKTPDVLPGTHDHLDRRTDRPGRNDRLDEDLEAERLEPGLRTGGEGDSGADPDRPETQENSNT